MVISVQWVSPNYHSSNFIPHLTSCPDRKMPHGIWGMAIRWNGCMTKNLGQGIQSLDGWHYFICQQVYFSFFEHIWPLWGGTNKQMLLKLFDVDDSIKRATLQLVRTSDKKRLWLEPFWDFFPLLSKVLETKTRYWPKSWSTPSLKISTLKGLIQGDPSWC